MVDRSRYHLSTMSTWIPQLFYDVIARLTPGTVIIASLVLVVIGPERTGRILQIWLSKPAKSYPNITIFIIISAMFSYTFAIILRGFWFLLSLFADGDVDFHKKYDFIKLTNPTAGNRISKLKAENSMARILILGFSLSFLINLLKLFNPFDTSRIILGAILLIAIAGSVYAKMCFARHLNSAVNNHAELLGYKNTEFFNREQYNTTYSE